MMKLPGNRTKPRNERAGKNTDWRRALVAGALALLVQLGMQSLKAQAAGVPGTWKVIPDIAINRGFFSVGQPIAVVSANDIWQVGYAMTGHWNGAAWSAITPADNYVSLSGVAAVATNDVWAVGIAPDAADPFNNAVTEHWDGSAWSMVPAPSGSTNSSGETSSQLVSVAAVSSNNVWAVGWTDTLGEHQLVPGNSD